MTVYSPWHRMRPGICGPARAAERAGPPWVGTALPLNVGGTLSVFHGSSWQHYTASNSGFSGAEPLALALDATASRGWELKWLA